MYDDRNPTIPANLTARQLVTAQHWVRVKSCCCDVWIKSLGVVAASITRNILKPMVGLEVKTPQSSNQNPRRKQWSIEAFAANGTNPKKELLLAIAGKKS